MSTIDSLLPTIALNIKQIQDAIPKKDKRILLSLAKQLSSGIFLTENQGNLMIKIINENIKVTTTVVPDAENVLKSKSWSKPFREVKRIRKIYISPEFSNSFVVEFSFNTKLREKISQINTQLRGNVFNAGAKYVFVLTEENLSLVLNAFAKDGFDIDEKITEFSKEIREIQKNAKNPFDVFDLTNKKIKTAVEHELGIDYIKDLRLLQDRKFRYQYKNTEKIPEFSLADQISNRDSRKVFINNSTTTFTDVVVALKTLNRFPLLLIFDGRDSTKDKKYLNFVEDAVKNLSLEEDIGIYFRYNKESDPAQFNQDISNLGYNKNLTNATTIAGISNNKVPKFMIKDGWKPQTVVSFTTSFRSNKSYVYCSDVDLIIYYGNHQPLDEEVNALL